MRVNVAIPEAHVSKPVLDAALESVTRLNEQLIERGTSPTFEQALHGQGIQWRPEPPGAEHFDHAGIVAQRGWGDCDDLAPWHAASLRKTGVDPGATAEVVRSGPHMWHAIVKRSDGSIDDPSKAAGMGPQGARGVHGAALPLMNPGGAVVGGSYIVRPGLALRPFPNGYQARVDLPWHWREHLSDPPTPTDYAMTALHSAPVAATALVGAIVGAIELGEAGGFADDEHLERLACIADACQGCHPQDLFEEYGPEHTQAALQVVGSFFGDAFRAISSPVAKAAKAMASPITSAVRFVQHPSLDNLQRAFTDPMTSSFQMIPHQITDRLKPVASMLAPIARMIPGPFGAPAAGMMDWLGTGFSEDPAVIRRIAMQNASSFIPGGGAASMLSHFPGGGGAASMLPFLQHGMPHPGAPPAPQGIPSGLLRAAMQLAQQGHPWPRGFA